MTPAGIEPATFWSNEVSLTIVLEMWKCFARKHLHLRLQYSYHSGNQDKFAADDTMHTCMKNIMRDLHISKLPALCKMCTHTTFWKNLTSGNSQHCAKCACTTFWGIFTSGNWQHCEKCAHIQHSERPSYQGPDGTVQDVQHSQRPSGQRTDGIIKDLHTKHSERPSLQATGGIFQENEECEGRLSCIKKIMVFIQIGLLRLKIKYKIIKTWNYWE